MLVQFKALGITPAYLKDLASLGYDGLSNEDIVQMKVANIDKAYITEMKEAGYPNLTASQIAQFKLFKIDQRFIEKATNFNDGKKPSPDKLIQMKATMESPR